MFRTYKKIKKYWISFKKINDFCKYKQLQAKCASNSINYEDEQKNEKNEKKLQSFKHNDVKLFNEISKKFHHNKAKRSNYLRTRANMNESSQYDKDAETLNDFETICRENNINSAVLSNPKR